MAHTGGRRKGKPYSLPFGFIQSPVLASITLATSYLGTALAGTYHGGLALSVYMDDILVSGDDMEALTAARSKLEEAAVQSGFEFHPQKTVGPAPALEVFNLALCHTKLEVAAERMAAFESAIMAANPDAVAGILGYVGTVNNDQRDYLKAL